METIDAKGLACPTPIIKAKKALRSNSEIAVEVDDEEAAENLEKMAQQLQYDVAKEDLGSGITKVTIKKTAPTTASAADYNGSSITNMMSVTQTAEESTVQKIDPALVNNIRLSDGYIVAIGTNVMGHGDDQLGKILIKSFIYSLTEQDVLPQYVLFYNGGIKLLLADSESVPDLKKLASLGVQILACGTCVDYYNVKGQLQVGEITNLYHILELMRTAQRVVRP